MNLPAPDDCHEPTSARRSKGELYWLVTLALISAAGIACYVLFDRQVFPSAAIDLKLSRQQATARSAEIAAIVGYRPEGTLKSTTFNYNQGAKTFLEYELGTEKAKELMRREFPV